MAKANGHRRVRIVFTPQPSGQLPQPSNAPPRLGRPTYYDERRQWHQYAFDPSERAVVGLRSREWTAIGSSELEVVREMARCLREIGEGRAPS